jgi:hypothetical protein
MSVYINKNYTKRDYEATNIVACETLGDELPDMNNYRKSIYGDILLAKLTPLYIQADIRYYGYL